MRIIDDKTNTAEPRADDLLNELGFIEVENSEGYIVYTHRELGSILFNKKYKDIIVTNNMGFPRCIKTKELKAINKQVEELGWFDE